MNLKFNRHSFGRVLRNEYSLNEYIISLQYYQELIRLRLGTLGHCGFQKQRKMIVIELDVEAIPSLLKNSGD